MRGSYLEDHWMIARFVSRVKCNILGETVNGVDCWYACGNGSNPEWGNILVFFERIRYLFRGG